MKQQPVWNAVAWGCNSKRFRKLNIFEHRSFRKEFDKEIKKIYTREQLEDMLKSLLMYYFWSKCEWEIILKSWPPMKDDTDEIKVDIYEQVMLNWDRFVDYVWQFVPKRRKTTSKEISKTTIRSSQKN